VSICLPKQVDQQTKLAPSPRQDLYARLQFDRIRRVDSVPAAAVCYVPFKPQPELLYSTLKAPSTFTSSWSVSFHSPGPPGVPRACLELPPVTG
jgi:hypothetical protein